MYKKNAYLIMAHNDFSILKKILKVLDDDESDFYIHIDKKSDFQNKSEFELYLKKSKIYFIDSMDITWGGRSQIDLEIALLKKSTEKEYGYYHLLSGVDFPLKRPCEINEYFTSNYGVNYIDFDSEDKDYSDRVKYYHFFQNRIGKNRSFLMYVQKVLLFIQKVIKVNRLKDKNLKIYKGANWFSITYDLASYVVENFYKFDKMFDFSICADEVFLQTIAMASPYRDTINKNCLREIDWKRGRPYIFRKNDFDELIKSQNFFARKFSTQIDGEIIDKLYHYLSD